MASKTTVRGFLVFWQFRAFTADRTSLEKRLERLGELRNQPPKKLRGKMSARRTFVDLLPRNDYKASLLRAVRSVLKKVKNVSDSDVEKFYKRHKDEKKSVCVSVINEIDKLDDVDFKKELTITLNKESGRLSFDADAPIIQQIKEEYKEMQKTMDTEQISGLLRKIVHVECFGVNFKGGCYYVREDQADGLATVQKVVDFFDEEQITFHKIPLYNDGDTQKAIAVAVEDDLLTKIEELKEEFCKTARAGKMTKTALPNRLTEINTLLQRLRMYKDDLSSKATRIQSRLADIESKVTGAKSFSEDAFKDEGFLGELLSL